MKQYVACLLLCKDQVMLIRKSRPEWMKGRLNGIGGHIEPSDETPLDAMKREFSEETQLTNPKWEQFAILSGEDDNNEPFVVHWFTCEVQRAIDYRAVGASDEPVNWWPMSAIRHSICNTPIMPNLLWLIELARAYNQGGDRAKCHRIQEVYTTI